MDKQAESDLRKLHGITSARRFNYTEGSNREGEQYLRDIGVLPSDLASQKNKCLKKNGYRQVQVASAEDKSQDASPSFQPTVIRPLSISNSVHSRAGHTLVSSREERSGVFNFRAHYVDGNGATTVGYGVDANNMLSPKGSPHRKGGRVHPEKHEEEQKEENSKKSTGCLSCLFSR